MKTSILSLGFVLLLAVNIHAQTNARLYAVTFYDRQFITIDTNSGVGKAITNLPISALDIAVSGGRLWLQLAGGSGVERLRQVDAWTGVTFGEKSFGSSIPGGEGALAFARDGTALAAKSFESTGTLFRIDMARTNVVPITTNGGLVPSLDGLAFDPDGVLYGLSQNVGGSFTLYLVNTNTGATMPVGGLGITFPATGGAVAGLAFSPDGTLFAALGNPTESRFYRVNRFTGAATFIGPIGFGGVSGIRFFIPPPGPLTISRHGELVRVSWPHVRGGFLETATTVKGVWTKAMLPVITNGTEAVSLVSPDQSERYFRLAK
jgi:hypothetical protein